MDLHHHLPVGVCGGHSVSDVQQARYRIREPPSIPTVSEVFGETSRFVVDVVVPELEEHVEILIRTPGSIEPRPRSKGSDELPFPSDRHSFNGIEDGVGRGAMVFSRQTDVVSLAEKEVRKRIQYRQNSSRSRSSRVSVNPPTEVK
jgi:hypothetical protein